MVSEFLQSLREDSLEREVASGWPELTTHCRARTKPTSSLGQGAHIPDRGAASKLSFSWQEGLHLSKSS